MCFVKSVERAIVGVVFVGLLLVGLNALGDKPAPSCALQFEVTIARELAAPARDGRLLVVLGQDAYPEPRLAISAPGKNAPPLLGRDIVAWRPGQVAILNRQSAIFPLRELAKLRPGNYVAQAVLLANRDFYYAQAPGNLFSVPVAVRLDPTRTEAVKLVLTERIPEPAPPEDPLVRFVRFRSDLLSRFHGRSMFLNAGIILPADYTSQPDRRYPLRVHIGGYGTRYCNAVEMMRQDAEFRAAWLADDSPRMVLLHLDGAGPLGDPYQTNSANNGPYGDAVVHELIPFVERTYRCLGKPSTRAVDGASTGGWVSLALQIFYADYFNGAWSHCPDPVDFRSFELIDIYRDANAYVNSFGFERPSWRAVDGEVRTTVRHECRMENVLGRDDLWTQSGKDWGAWNAVFGPRGADGKPVALWHPRTGKIDKSVLDHWKKYDLRLVLEKNWPVLGPKLRGKLHIWVGDADDYFLNNAVHLLDEFLAKAQPAYEGSITFGPGKGHDWRGISEKELMKRMGERVGR